MRVRKWSLRILIGVVALVLLLLVAVQVVLWTDMPRNWVLGAIQQKLQLRVSAASMETGWGGKTSLSEVTLALPLAQEAFLQTPRLAVDHTPLLKLFLGFPLKVESIAIERPNLLVRQQSDGRWNLEEVAELVSRAGGGKTAETQPQPKSGGVPELPKVAVTDAVIRLIDVRGRQATLAPLSIRGDPQGPLVWKYEANIPDLLHLRGEVAPGGNWQHAVTVELRRLTPVVKPFLDRPTAATLATLDSFKLNARWDGRVEGALKGRLDLKDFFAAGYTATGPLNVAFDDGVPGVTTITPAGVTVTPPHERQFPRARASAGVIALDGKSATIKDLSLAFAGGEIRLGGSYAWTNGEGRLDSWWNQIELPAGVVHSGSLTASLRQPWPNQPVIDVKFNGTGRTATESWGGRVALSGAGTAWDKIDWRLTAPELRYQTPEQTYNLDRMTAALSTRGDRVTLDSLSLPPGNLYGKWQRGTLAASGRYVLSTGDWSVDLAGERWPTSTKDNATANFNLNLFGDREWATLDQLFVEGDGAQIWASGVIAYRAAGMPVELNLYGWYPPLEYTWHERDTAAQDDVRFSGKLHSELHLTKGAWPLNLDIRGALYARDFRVKDHAVGDVAVNVEGFAKPEQVHIASTRLELFSGIWGLAADYHFDRRRTDLRVKAQELSLAQLDNFAAAPPNLRGTFSGQVSVTLPEFDPNRMTAAGDYTIHNLGRFNPPPPTTSPAVAAALDKPTTPGVSPAATQATFATARPDAGPPQIVIIPTTRSVAAIMPAAAGPTTRVSITPIADTVTGTIAVADGTVRLDPILRRNTRSASGETRATVTFPVNAPHQMHVVANAAAWPLDLSDKDGETSNVLVWLQTKGINVDLQHLTARGPLDVQASIARRARTVADVSIKSYIRGRRIDLRSITGEGLGGHIGGDGYIYLDNPMLSAGRVDWQNVDAESLIAFLPAAKGLAGKYTGSVRFSPTDVTTDRNATGPFAIRGNVIATGGNWKGIDIGNASFTAHTDYQKAVVDQFDWAIADGTVKGWTRVTWREPSPFVHVNLEFDKLNLDQIVAAGRPKGQQHKPVPGLLAGTVVAAGQPFDERRRTEASGEAHVRLTDSDLGNVPAVNLLYTVLSVKYGPPTPTGKGFAEARLEGQRLEFPVIRYFNRGTDLWASAAVVNVFKGTESPIEGSAAGSARPLKDLKLPFMADFDKIVGALQGGVATVSLEGTLGNPNPKVIPFAQAGEAFRRFMVGEVKNEVRGTAGR